MEIYWTTICDIIEETTEIKTYILAMNDAMKEFSWTAGAHTHLALKGFNDGEKPNRSMVRHMSIASLPIENQVAITTRIKPVASPYKIALKNLKIGSDIGLFGTSTNIPLLRQNQKVILFSSGVGLATYRPIVLEYLTDQTGIPALHSLTISTKDERLYSDIFTTNDERNFTSETVNQRAAFYQRAKELANDTNALYYLVGSDDFLKQSITLLLESGIAKHQIKLDKHDFQLAEFL